MLRSSVNRLAIATNTAADAFVLGNIYGNLNNFHNNNNNLLVRTNISERIINSSLSSSSSSALHMTRRYCSSGTKDTAKETSHNDNHKEQTEEEEENNNNNNNENKNNNALKPRHKGFIEPSDDIVMETARKALAREGRDEIPEAIVWSEDTSAPPILAQGKKNIYDYTDDIPEHVKPYWHHEYYQQREYFRLQREKKPLKERLRMWIGLGSLAAILYGALVVFRVWVEQPREIRKMREEILGHTYGRVLELAAGHGQNIGAYPYAVHEIVLSDSNPQQLQTLRYRIPRTAYPKYEVKRARAESLDKVFKPHEFDCVVDMFGLCHIHDPVAALRQMQQIVKPSGMILLLEHGRSPYPIVNYFLDYFEKRHEVNTHGCRWNSPIMDYVKESRLEIKELRNKHYGTTYYIVGYPEVLEAYVNSNNSNNMNNNNNSGDDENQKKKGWTRLFRRGGVNSNNNNSNNNNTFSGEKATN